MIKKGDKFPLADIIPNKVRYRNIPYYLVEFTGEVRKPKAGELFLSGALVTGYYTSSDLSSEYPIGRLIKR
jgi:hypothetical protein